MQFRKLSEISNIIMGQSPNSNSYNEDGEGVPFFQGKADFGKISPTVRIFCSKPTKLASELDILMSVRAPVGDVNIANKKCCIGRGLCAIRGYKEVNNKYLYYYLLTAKGILNSKATGSTFKAINKSVLEEVMVPMTTLEIQDRIVRVLDKAQELIDKRKEQIEFLDELVKSKFTDMFGDQVLNPKGWEKGKIADIVIKTQYGTSNKADEQKGEFKVLRMNNITYSGQWDFSSMKYVDLNEKDKEKYLVYKGEVLFNRTNSKELVGKTAVYKEEEPMAYAGYLVKAIPNERATGEFISAYMNTKYVKSKLFNMAKNIVGMANINAEEFKKIDVYIPPIELQNEYIKFVEQVDKLKFEMEKSLKELENNFKSLMQRSFKGEIFN